MRATYRRPRKADRLASAEAVRSILDQLRSAVPDLLPAKERELIRLLRAVRHVHRYPATDTLRGRPSPWQRQDLLKVGAHLLAILERETANGLSLSSFIDHYLRLLDFPQELLQALSAGEINLFEAEQLARITHQRLGVSPAQARRLRAELLHTHVQTRLSGERLRQRVAEVLRASTSLQAEAQGSTELDLDDFDPYDPTHLFWDQIKQLGFALRNIGREDVTEEEIEELLRASEPVLTVLARIQRRKEKKSAPQQTSQPF